MVARLADAAFADGLSLPEMLRQNLLPEIRRTRVADLKIERQPREAPHRVMSLRHDLVDALSAVAEAAFATKGEVLYTFAARYIASLPSQSTMTSRAKRQESPLQVSAAA